MCLKSQLIAHFEPRSLGAVTVPAASEDEVDDILCLVREGGVEFLNHLLTKAVPPDGSESPNTSNIHE